MKPHFKMIKVTLCGPGDVTKEIAIAQDVITELNLQHSDALNCYIKHQHWITDSVPDLSATAQAVINRQLIDDSDILVAIFWSRFGTPTQTAASGTEEEIRRGVSQGKRVMVYFSEIDPLPQGADAQQLTRLSMFREFLQKQGLCASFSSRSEFRALVQRHVTKTVHDILAHSCPNTDTRQTQVIIGNNNIQAAGPVKIVNPSRTVKHVIARSPGSISSKQQQEIMEMIDSLVEGTAGKTRSAAYSEWWPRFKNYMGVTKYEEVLADEMPKARAWFRLEKGKQTSGLKTKAPDQWRNARIRAIKAFMADKGLTNETFYPIVATRLRIRKPFHHLTELTKTDLQRVYNLTRREL